MKQWQNFYAFSKAKTCIEALAADVASQLEQSLDEPPGAASVAPLDTCLAHLTQIAGVLRIMEYREFALFVDEMIGLLGDAIRFDNDGQAERSVEARQALFIAINDFSALMEGVLSGQISHWSEFSVPFNRMRKARGLGLIFASSALLTKPEMKFSELFRTSNHKIKALLERYVGYYEDARTLIEGGKNPVQGISVMANVFTNLEIISRDYRFATLWGLCATLLASIPKEQADAGHPVVRLLCSFSPLLQEVKSYAHRTMAQNIPEQALEELLDAFGSALQDNDRLQSVRLWFNLDIRLSRAYRSRTQSMMVGYFRKEAFLKVIRLLIENVGALSLEINEHIGDTLQLGDLERIAGNLEAIQGTVDALGLSSLSETLAQSLAYYWSHLASLPPDGEIDDEAGKFLQLTAQVLYQCETGLSARAEQLERAIFVSTAGNGEASGLTGTRLTVVLEAIKNLELVLISINHYADAYCDRSFIREAASLLESARGALTTVPVERAVAYVAGAGAYVQRTLAHEGRLELDRPFHDFTQLIINTILYLEQFTIGRAEQLTHIVEESDQLLRSIEDFPALSAGVFQVTQVLESLQATDEARVESIAEVSLPFTEIEVPVESAEAVDESIREVFIEEAGEILEALCSSYAALNDDHDNPHALTELRRSFHTLKGSGLMVQARAIAAVAWAIENLLNHVISGSVPVNDALLALIGDVRNELPALIDNFRTAGSSTFVSEYVAQIESLAADLLSVPVHQADTTLAADSEGAEDVASEQDDDLPEPPCEMFVAESERQVALIRELLDSAFNVDDHGQVITTTSYLIPVHTLYGNKRIADFRDFGRSVSQLERLLQDNPYRKINHALKTLLRQFCALTGQVTEAVRTGEQDAEIDTVMAVFLADLEQVQADFAAPGSSAFSGSRSDKMPVEPRQEVDALADRPLASEAVSTAEDEQALLMQGFLNEAKSSAALIAHLYEGFSAVSGSDTGRMNDCAGQLQEQFQFLEGAAMLVDQHALAALSHAACGAFQPISEGAITPGFSLLALLDEAVVTLEKGMLALQQGEAFPQIGALCQALQQATADQLAACAMASVQEGSQESEDEIEEALLAVFLEEAGEILQETDSRLADWRQAPGEQAIAEELLRLLHTLKGSAALVGQQALSDCAHEFESLVIKAAREGVSEDVLARSDAYLATLQRQYAHYQGNDADTSDAGAEAPSTQANPAGSNIIPLPTERITPEIDEHVRVSGKLLRTLLNDADEIGIARNRVEQQIAEMNTLMHEMDETLGRLQGYIRAFEEHTPSVSQLTREGAATGSAGDFDALEMDRYTELQQISLALTEDYDDLKDIRSNLAGRVRSMDMVLADQQRVTNKLQDGLISSQMVPFAGIVPRLRRLTQQVSAELKKQVVIRFSNPEGKIDRSVLQVIVNPIEHMIRNAIDHGIESAAEREAAGKPLQAEILVKLYRQGANILLDITDDGRGINIGKIRQRAIAEGLIAANEQVPDHDIIQLVLRAGFTTTDAVSRISGRGVGLDVVKSEIAQIGGDIDILSSPGAGTTFRIRLPLTSSLNRALLFTVQETDYVILLNTIDGIILEKVETLRSYYEQDTMPLFQYAGKSYEMAYLGGLIGGRAQPAFGHGMDASASLLLISGAHRNMALQVDSIIGSRELVVKSLGAQFAAVPSLTGGVILGDGRVAIVLDPVALVDHYAATRGLEDEELVQDGQQGAARAQPVIELDTRRTVLVVDDSITVRKVTSSILKRNGMNVLLAKNGMEAVEILQNTTPDLMLLDIEMPQMDGFEVASYIRRQQDAVKDLPIIMITSRIGEKHRSRAAELGVNQYMCKPFQEEYLLEAIAEYNA